MHTVSAFVFLRPEVCGVNMSLCADRVESGCVAVNFCTFYIEVEATQLSCQLLSEQKNGQMI